MPDIYRTLDARVVDELHHFPTVDMVKKLFPSVRMRGRSVMCNPLRGETHPSFSCFIRSDGVRAWKDHATGETGDNIAFYRLVHPELKYDEAVNELSWFLLGKSAYVEGEVGREGRLVDLPRPERRVRRPRSEQGRESVLRIVSVDPFAPGSAPESLLSFARRRGISDRVSSLLCNFVVFENTNLAGVVKRDPANGLPIMDAGGRPVLVESRSEAVALRNDIGGWSLRVPPSESREGFKGCDRAFVSSIMAGGRFPVRKVFFEGDDTLIERCVYDAFARRLWINPQASFCGIEPQDAALAQAFVSLRGGTVLPQQDLQNMTASLNSLCQCGRSRDVIVVEGMFDALSAFEMGMCDRADLVVLNSVSLISHAAPFLAAHENVVSLLDNDLKSSAGQKAFHRMGSAVVDLARSAGLPCLVRSDSARFAPYKDVNDYLMNLKGFSFLSEEVTKGNGGRKKNVYQKKV